MPRLFRYVLTMFPPLLALLGAGAFLSTWLGLQALGRVAPLTLGIYGAVGLASTPLWMLLVRLLDDWHDAPQDRRLAAAGDPRYLARPIVTGAITVAEVGGLAVAAAAALLLLNLLAGSLLMAGAVAAGLGVTWLGFRWFYIPALARNPGPVAYLARKSLSILIGIYAVVAFHLQWPAIVMGGLVVPLVLAPALEVAAWETARKIRLPEDETEYATYSSAFGWRRAALLPALFSGLAAACLIAVALGAGLGPVYPVVILVAATSVALAGLRLRLAPTRARTRLEPVVLGFGAVAHLGLALALALTQGLPPW